MSDIADVETVQYNNETDFNDITSSKSAQIAARNILNKFKKIARKKSNFPFNLSDIADAETLQYNNDTDINDNTSSKSAQIAAKKLTDKYRQIRKRKITAAVSDTNAKKVEMTKLFLLNKFLDIQETA